MPSKVILSWIITIVLFFTVATGAGHKSGPITCVCSTLQCEQQGIHQCTTEGFCFTQYLNRGLGGPSLVRGCIGDRTPLLCENRKPTKAKNWPLLHCCNTNLCNQGAVPTPPPWDEDIAREIDSLKSIGDSSISRNRTDIGSPEAAASVPESSPASFVSSVTKSPWPHIISPIYLSVLVLGIVSLVIIGIVAATVIRRNNRFYAEHYGALEFQPGKTQHVHCDCDSEIESVGSSQPYLHIVCPNRNT